MENEKEAVNDNASKISRLSGFFKNICGVDFADGELVPIDFVVRNLKTILIIVAIMLLYVGNRYNCTRKMTEIRKLRTEIVNLKNESISLSSELTGLGRPSQIKLMLEEKGIDVKPATSPSYKLIRKKYGE